MDSDNYIQSDMFIIWMILCVVSIYLLGFIVDEVRGKLMYLIKYQTDFLINELKGGDVAW